MQITWRRWAVAVAALAALGTVGCEPVDPPPVLVVTSTADLPDAAPGDGVCEATPGVGDCTLPAAIEEGNALGAASISVPAGRFATRDLVVTGDLSLVGDVRTTLLGSQEVRVAAGASLVVDGIATNDIPGAHLVVEGTLELRRSSIVVIESIWPAIDVLPGGTALVSDSVVAQVFFPGVPAIRNAGTVVLVHTAVDAGPELAIVLENQGVVHGRASVVTRCTGTAPVSHGANASSDASCGWSGPGDLSGAALNYDVQVTVPFHYLPRVTSVLVDAIPIGAPGCDGAALDLLGTTRGVDGNGDGVPGCDIGAVERPGPALPAG